MPELAEISNANASNANAWMTHLASPGSLAEAQRAHEERPFPPQHETPAGNAMQAPAGVAPRALLEDIRANQKQAENQFLQRAQARVAPPVPETSQAMSHTMPTPSVAPPMVPPQQPLAHALTTPVAPAPPVAQAAEAVAPVSSASLEKHLIFSLGAVRYAVPLDHIIEIAELENLTPVPNLPEWIMGITNLRGDIVSLIDLNVLIGEASEEPPRGSNLLVVQTSAGDLTTCLVVDRVYGVLNVNPTQIQRLDKVANTVIATHTRGYFAEGDEFLSLINLEGLLRALELPH